MYNFPLLLLSFLVWTCVLNGNRDIAASAKDNGTESGKKLLMQRANDPPFKAMPNEVIVPMVLEHVMKDERRKQVQAMAKVTPALDAQKAETEYFKNVESIKERLGPKIINSRKNFHIYVHELGKLKSPPGAPERKANNEGLLALHEAGRNIENLGMINKATRQKMMHKNTRPLPNPTKATQLGLKLFMKNEYKKHLIATNKVYHSAKLEAINNYRAAQQRVAKSMAYPSIVRDQIDHERMRSQEPHLAALGVPMERPFGINPTALVWGQEVGMNGVQKSAMNIEKVGTMNKEMRKYMQTHAAPIINPNPRHLKNKRKRKGG
ncbi:hypothetical protein MMC10_009136 [Thelotrema lepadinum]|nr:hypothetical protein [Thelotrema lepadinum]